MPASLTDAALTIKAMIQSGYRSTASALAELVDNSIDADANNIKIIAVNKKKFVKKKTQNNINELAVLDNGKGMNSEELGGCLSLGHTMRSGNIDELGKFGFGLKGSSYSQCSLIEVYSWRGGLENCQMCFVDLNAIFNDGIEEIEDPISKKLPALYTELFGDDLGESGTLVRWQQLERVDVKKTDALSRRIDKELCRIYRHFLDEDDRYGVRKRMKIVTVAEENHTIIDEKLLLANDPLYLLTPSNVPGYEDKAIFVPWEDKFTIDVDTPDGLAKVEFISSIARPEIQSLGGSSYVGKHCDANDGISFLRSAREIDFGHFGYVDGYDPRNRWWGLEVRFDAKLDEIFGVTINKQYVRNIRKLTPNAREEYVEATDIEENDLDYYRAKALLEMDHQLNKIVKDLMAVVKTRGKGKRKPGETTPNTVDRVNDEVAEDTADTKSGEEAKTKSVEEKKNNLTDLFTTHDTSLTADEVEEIVDESIDNRVDLLFSDWPGKLFLDLNFPANGAVGLINRKHKFYEIFWEHLEQSADPKGLEAMRIMLMALVRAEDENTRRHGADCYGDLRDSWGRWCDKLLEISN